MVLTAQYFAMDRLVQEKLLQWRLVFDLEFQILGRGLLQ